MKKGWGDVSQRGANRNRTPLIITIANTYPSPPGRFRLKPHALACNVDFDRSNKGDLALHQKMGCSVHQKVEGQSRFEKRLLIAAAPKGIMLDIMQQITRNDNFSQKTRG
jgi:hypothetical protein